MVLVVGLLGVLIQALRIRELGLRVGMTVICRGQARVIKSISLSQFTIGLEGIGGSYSPTSLSMTD